MNPHHYALVVGINRYPGISDLTGPRADANAFAGWVADPNGGGLPPDHIKTVCATAVEEQGYVVAQGSRPTNVEIDNALQNITRDVRTALRGDQGVWKQTRLYLYVAGHGFAPQGGQGALFLADAEEGAFSRNIELRKYLDWCLGCAWFSEVVMFADCCRTRLASLAPGFGPHLDECSVPWKNRATTWVIGFGATLGSETFEPLDTGPVAGDEARGFFTAALVEGLKGGARIDPQTNKITHQTLAGYVRSLVRERTSGQQDADIIGPAGTAVVFDAAQAQTMRAVTIVFPAGFTGAAEVRKDGAAAVAIAGGGTTTVQLTDGIYEVVAITQGSVAFAGDGLFKVAGEARNVQL